MLQGLAVVAARMHNKALDGSWRSSAARLRFSIQGFVVYGLGVQDSGFCRTGFGARACTRLLVRIAMIETPNLLE